MTRAIYKIENGLSPASIATDFGRLFSFLEFFYTVDDRLIQLLSISTLREDSNPFRQFRKQLFERSALNPLIPPEIISENEYYDVLLSFPPEKVIAELAYREFTKEANYTLAIDNESGNSFLEIHTFDDRPLEECNEMVLPKSFRSLREPENLTNYKGLGVAFYDSYERLSLDDISPYNARNEE